MIPLKHCLRGESFSDYHKTPKKKNLKFVYSILCIMQFCVINSYTQFSNRNVSEKKVSSFFLNEKKKKHEKTKQTSKNK